MVLFEFAVVWFDCTGDIVVGFDWLIDPVVEFDWIIEDKVGDSNFTVVTEMSTLCGVDFGVDFDLSVLKHIRYQNFYIILIFMKLKCIALQWLDLLSGGCPHRHNLGCIKMHARTQLGKLKYSVHFRIDTISIIKMHAPFQI